jgi:hypothetical protein
VSSATNYYYYLVLVFTVQKRANFTKLLFLKNKHENLMSTTYYSYYLDRVFFLSYFKKLSVSLKSDKNHSTLKFGIMLNNEAIVLESFI